MNFPFLPLLLCARHPLRADELDVLVTGTQKLDFDELAKATTYVGGYGGDHPTIKTFWGAVKDMPLEEQKRLLMFVTGSKKVEVSEYVFLFRRSSFFHILSFAPGPRWFFRFSSKR